MKTILKFLRWGMLYLITIIMVIVMFWENSLPMLSIDHTLIFIITVVVFGISINAWINHHPNNLLVSNNYLVADEKKKNESTTSSEQKNAKTN